MRFLAGISAVLCLAILLFVNGGASAYSLTLQPSVTGTPEGPSIIVPDQVNVRLGPGTNYDKIGVLIAGQEAPALGRSPGGEWILIAYPSPQGDVAWVYAPFVVLDSSQLLPIVEPPPTPTPRVTATIDPTLAAQFNLGDAPETRLPTFTPPAAPVTQPTFEPTQVGGSGAVPPILPILGLLVVGVFGLVISVLRGQ
jgi:hypothetical protein